MNTLSNRRIRPIRERIGPAIARGALGAASTLLALLLLPTVGANAAPTGPSPVDQVIGQLKAQGYTVIVNRSGSRPPEECSVKAVRLGQTYSRNDHGLPGEDHLVATVLSKTVYVDVKC